MVELSRLCGMQVIEEVADGKLSGEEHLTTKPGDSRTMLQRMDLHARDG